MTYANRILDYLWSVAPEGATNSQIARALGLNSHQTVYMVTQDLLRRKLVRAERHGHAWVFLALEDEISAQPPRVTAGVPRKAGGLTPRQFEALARDMMSEHFGVLLAPGSVPGVRKEFDLVAPDGKIVGDAKYYTLVRGLVLPPAKFSVIAEHVWLLEKTGAPVTFLVFGNDRSVPARWLERFGDLVGGLAFYFLDDDGSLEQLR
jgi:hypothetical protein